MKDKIIKQRKEIEKFIFVSICFLSFLIIVIPSFIIVYSNKSDVVQIVHEEKYNYYQDGKHILDNNATFTNNEGLLSQKSEIIETKEYDNFFQTIAELISIKYPEFVIDELLKEETKKEYDFKKEYLEVSFSNYIYEEELKEEKLIINYAYIYEYLEFEVNIDTTVNAIDENAVDESKSIVAFTFDDGPILGLTDKIVDSLAANKSTATFFMLGLSMENNQNLIKYVYDNGNEIGLHGYSHRNFSRMGLEEIQNELDKTNELVYEATGEYSKIIRPPYGSFNSNISANIPYSYILWNMDTYDWKHKNTDGIVDHVLSNVKDGDVILFHDTYQATVDAIEKLLPELYLRGFEVVDVSTLAKVKNIDLNTSDSYYYFR